MKRPASITVISIVLAWLAVANIFNAVIWNLPVVQELLSRLPSRDRIPRIGGPLLSIVCLTYGVAAGIASVALWHMHRMSARAYAAWCGTVLLSGLYLVAVGFEPNILVGLLFVAGMTAFVALGYSFISSRVPSVRSNTSLEHTREG